MNSKIRNKVYIMALALLVIFMIPTHVKASDIQSIRVGLRSLYKEKEKLTIKNKEINLGYSLDYRYIIDESFISNTGFLFTPVTGYYYILNKEFREYKDAKKVSEILKQLGVEAFPTILYRDTWNVYIGGNSDKEKVEAQYSKIRDRFGYSYSPIQSDNKFRLQVSGSDDVFLIDINNKNAYPQFSAARKNSAGIEIIDLGSRQYRGRIEIGRYHSNLLTAVNITPIEEYLYGVIPSEMLSTWPMEALKAQAVCARSYAIRKAGYRSFSNAKNAYTMDDTTSFQVYKGYTVETARTNQAVQETKGETLSYKNQIIIPYYFSTSGGRTENIEDVWSMGHPYYRSMADLYELEPERKPWIVKLQTTDIVANLNKKGINLGSIKNIFPEIITNSGRVFSLRIQGTNRSTVLQGGTIRSILSLDSTKFKIIQYGDNPDEVAIRSANGTKREKISNSYVIDGNYRVSKADMNLEQYIVISADNLTNFPRITPKSKSEIYFAGQGYGHGVGMSQSGAKGMANAGYTYKEILYNYYKGADVR